MKCPHCTVEFHSQPKLGSFNTFSTPEQMKDPDQVIGTQYEHCPSCHRIIIRLYYRSEQPVDVTSERRPLFSEGPSLLLYPKSVARRPLSADVSKEYAQDFREAAAILTDSPKASAALSRRCLQHVLREGAKTKKKDLADQIDEVMPTLPQHLRGLIDAVRTVGNFAAHPTKSTHTGEIIEVEPGEAELLLDVLEMAFDFYFVQPAEVQKKRDAINAKLAAAGKPGMK